MCGICGQYNFGGAPAPELDAVKKMTALLRHRGPDDAGYFHNKHVALGHARLSIIDLDTGRQPIGNEDGAVQLVFNGEIYNYRELKKELEAKGHRFRTHTDTEVIVHLYEEYGVDCLQHLRGMFAFALWDDHTQTLFLARDRVGQKPLYYFMRDGVFSFASELKAFRALPHFKRLVNNEAIYAYLRYGYVPAPSTIFADVYALLPGHYCRVHAQAVSVERYWQLSYAEKRYETEEEYCSQIRSLLGDATRLRMRSDVPLGAFLSGGLDSSIIVALMAQQSSQKIKTFSIGFSHRDFDERSFARIVAKHCGTDHEEFIVEPDMYADLDAIVRANDQPFADSSSVATYYLARMTRKYVTVALNGDGGDENFAGYPRHRGTVLYEKCRHMPIVGSLLSSGMPYRMLSGIREGERSKHVLIKLKKFLQTFARRDTPFYHAYHDWFCYFNDMQRTQVLSPVFAESLKQGSDRHLADAFGLYADASLLDKILCTDTMTYLPNDLLIKVDSATMAHSLEARSPFLDHIFMEYAASIPGDYKIRGKVQKYILKEAFKDVLPTDIVSRAKMGFGVPVAEWLQTDLKEYAVSLLTSRQARERGIFNADYVERLFAEHTSGKINHGSRLWNLLILEKWFRAFVD